MSKTKQGVSYIRSIYVLCIEYETQKDKKKVTRSKPMKLVKALKSRDRYRGTGHNAWVEELGTKALIEWGQK